MGGRKRRLRLVNTCFVFELTARVKSKSKLRQILIFLGAESIGYPGIVGEMFPLGGADLVLHFYSTCNERLRQYLEKKAEEEDQVEKTDK